jgi:hypothetical protein
VVASIHTALAQMWEVRVSEASQYRRARVSEAEVAALREENIRLKALIGRPYVGAWADEIVVEAAHQRDRWGAEQDHGKAPEDWFWLIGYLAGKCLAAHKAGDASKAHHHTVSTAAVLAHWAAAIDGNEMAFRPGLGAEKVASLAVASDQRGTQ